MKKIKYFPLLFLGLFFSCNKLDVKPDLSRVIPSTLEDFQGLLDYSGRVFNVTFSMLGEVASNDFYVINSDFQANFTPLTSSVYKWEIENLNDPYFSDWNASYEKILYCNIVLDGLDIHSTVQNDTYKNVMGQALFHRAHSFFMLVDEFAPVYSLENLNKPAIPLRTSSDINLNYPLSSVKETYNLIIEDLKSATKLLPEKSIYKTRPNKAAAFGLLARVYLAMEQYDNALKSAESSLALYSELMDYNLLSAAGQYPFDQFNVEVILQGSLTYDYLLTRNVLKVNPNLVAQYENSDLRKQLFFINNPDGTFGFKGNYNGLNGVYELFGGIATDEIYLIKAESAVRLNNIPLALESLNTLLRKRYDKNQFKQIEITNPEELLRKVLLERRKELLLRGRRWTDLRRLNKDSRFAVTLNRELNGQTYTLPPNDARYVFPIPKYVTTIKY